MWNTWKRFYGWKNTSSASSSNRCVCFRESLSCFRSWRFYGFWTNILLSYPSLFFCLNRVFFRITKEVFFCGEMKENLFHKCSVIRIWCPQICESYYRLIEILTKQETFSYFSYYLSGNVFLPCYPNNVFEVFLQIFEEWTISGNRTDYPSSRAIYRTYANPFLGESFFLSYKQCCIGCFNRWKVPVNNLSLREFFLVYWPVKSDMFWYSIR